MTERTYRCIGIMTGNSLDAVDVILTEFKGNNIQDICGISKDIPIDIGNRFRQLKFILSQNGCDIESFASKPENQFIELHDSYIKLVAETVNQLLSQNHISPKSVDIIGFHGQTCCHCPPSIAQSRDPTQIYTLQIGSGQMLADLTNIPVAFDFRSDDIMNLGEGAPLAPIHNKHIAADLKNKDIFPVAFCNGGNTGNIAIISQNKITGHEVVIGWDTGPFNHFTDQLMRENFNLPCDMDGEIGKQGKINYRLLRRLFETSASTHNQENFITKLPPKSSDPAWYKTIPELADKNISLADRVRTAEFFSAYALVYNLGFIPDNYDYPKYFLVFGGGWRNPIVYNDFNDLLNGKIEVLPEHQEWFNKISSNQSHIEWSDHYGYNGKYMEARIFADMAKCKLTGEAFSLPETTGCLKPTIAGIIASPGGENRQLWSRAAPNWHKKLTHLHKYDINALTK